MGEEQRAAQRIDLPEPVPAKVGDAAAKIVEMSLVGCRVEHAEKLAMGSTWPLSFEWRGERVLMTVKVARTELRSVAGKMVYSTGMQFAAAVDSSPEVVQRIMGSLVKKSAEERPAAEVPIFFERAPFFRDDEPDEPPPPPPPVRAPSPGPGPVASVAPPSGAIGLEEEYPDIAGPSFELDFNPAATATHMDGFIEPEIATQSFELDMEDAALGGMVAHEHHDQIAGQSFELDVETNERYARCELEDGKWTVTQTNESKQPREGFTILDPGDQREIDQFCKTYEYADPDTRRMIRVSCELMIAKKS